MTTEEAINLIERLKAEIEWDYSLEYQEALNMAVRALKKRIPRLAEFAIKGNTDFYACPSCGCLTVKIEDYCIGCGQRLKYKEGKE